MTWKEFTDSRDLLYRTFGTNREPTDIDCPECGKKIFRRTDIVLTSYPPQYKYECECGWNGTSR